MPSSVSVARCSRGQLPSIGRRWSLGAAGTCRHFLTDARGSTAIEYGLIGGLVFLVIAGAIHLFADRTEAMYAFIGTKVGQTP